MITRLKLTNFTSFSEFGIDFSPKINVIIGENGTGKTQLLKAAYALCNGAAIYKGNPNTTKKELTSALTTKLVRLFVPLGERLGRLRRHGATEVATLRADFSSGSMVSASFSSNSKALKVEVDPNYSQDRSEAIFIPTKEVLSLVRGMTDRAHDQHTVELIFDAGYVDLARALIQKRLNDPETEALHDPRLGSLIPKLTNLIGGRYRLKNGGFDFQPGKYAEKASPARSKATVAQAYQDSTTVEFATFSEEHLPAGMTAEGFRKVGMLQRLLSDGTLNPGTSGPLFWDEPESNLNPKLMKLLVESLLTLSRNGQQVILATHDYVLLKWFDLLMEKGKGDHVRFHSLYRDSDNRVIVESVDDYNSIRKSAISDAFAELYDEDVKRALG